MRRFNHCNVIITMSQSLTVGFQNKNIFVIKLIIFYEKRLASFSLILNPSTVVQEN